MTIKETCKNGHGQKEDGEEDCEEEVREEEIASEFFSHSAAIW
ncbi:MAG: hypothetical protein Q8R02_23750 [Hyphomonadaceae bacterium]|nr:hypothetical protein [Hyphomonadaceae bacterium]